MNQPRANQLDLFAWAESRPRAQVIDLTPIIVSRMPAHDLQYAEPAKIIRAPFPVSQKGRAA